MFIRSARHLILSAGLLGSLLLMGCGTDMLTYSHDYQHEGLKEYNNGDYVDAIGAFTAASKQDPADYQTQYWLGQCYEQTGAYTHAVLSYRLCLTLIQQSPRGRMDVQTHTEAFDDLANLIGRNDNAEAEIDSLTSEASTTKSAEDYHLLGRIFTIRGDPDSALDNYRHAIILDPDNFALNKEFGLYLLKMNQTQEAQQVLQHAHDLNPDDSEVNQSLASAN
ncbi:MAG TPA: tetratricopeptide repeat protein [Tepidisphaeraceae bacterium]|nr:tetratricopeptide repeat protein [Tepidisphaeraceae bacterium]